ncbi:Tartrate transporter [Leminorella grimontii]|nr:Tartrate transporter [Leminorella grimontii]
MATFRNYWRYFVPPVVSILLALMPAPAGLDAHAWLYFAVFMGVIAGLILEPVPGAVVAMIGISVIAILSPWLLFSPEQMSQGGFKFTSKALSWAVSGFSNSVIWLIFAAFMFGIGYEKTGLGRRIALMLVKKMGHKTLFLGYAVMLSELVLAPVTPSNTARGAGIIYPIIRNLPPLYDSKPDSASARSIGSYVMWMGISADCVTSAIFLTAMAPNLLLAGLMKGAAGSALSWGDWFLGMLPLSILLILLVPWLAYVLYPPTLKVGDQEPKWAGKELESMGRSLVAKSGCWR